MADQLWFLRHGDAEPHGTLPDAQRRLTPRGETQSVAAGAALRRLGIEMAHVFASPKVRAIDTARIASDAGIVTEPVVHDAVLDLDRAGALELAALAGPDENVLLVGHQPDLGQVVYDLTGARARVRKGGLIGVQLGGLGPRPELIVVLRPIDLSHIGGIPLGA